MKINGDNFVEIIEKIDSINDMLNIICEELNNYDEIDDYEIELDEISYSNCLDKKKKKAYKIAVTVKRDINN